MKIACPIKYQNNSEKSYAVGNIVLFYSYSWAYVISAQIIKLESKFEERAHVSNNVVHLLQFDAVDSGRNIYWIRSIQPMNVKYRMCENLA